MKWGVGSGEWERGAEERCLSSQATAASEALPTPHSPLPTPVVVNGDDFGYSAAINAAIVRSCEAGVLRSATLLVNQPATRAALALARARPGLGVGLHVNLTEGVPVLPPREVPSLVDRHGHFYPILPQLAGLAAGRTSLDEVERELRAQFAIMLDAGLRPTHLDGHLHAHAFPGVLPIVVRLMAEHGVRAMRSPLLGAWLGPQGRRGAEARGCDDTPAHPHPHSPVRLFASAPLQSPSRAALLDRAGIARAGRLFDAARFLGAADPAAALAGAVGAAGGLVEVMTHPAWNRDAARGAAEVALITDPRLPGLLAARGVAVRHYGDPDLLP